MSEARLSELRLALTERGLAVVRAADVGLAIEDAARTPWAFAERLLGERPCLVERQPIKPVPGGRSFASNSAPTPLHTDSQMFAGAPPGVQVMACVGAAERGGEHLFVDGWALIAAVRARDPELHRLLLEAPRRIPFVFGDVFGPTVARRGGAVAFTHSPMAPRGDGIAERLAPFVDAAPRIELRTAPGEILVADNHRMLHGRRGFVGGAREYTRLLVWLTTSPPPPADLHAHAARVAAATTARLAGAPPAVLRRLGLLPSAPDRGLGVVLEMLRGVPPGVLARREGIPEPELYRMRDAALAAAEAALGGALPAGDDDLSRLLESARPP
jgi:hypothetical protein